MNYIVNRKNLAAALAIVAPFAGRNKVLLILNNIKVAISGSQMTISSYDAESYVSRRVELDYADADTEFLVNAKDFADYVAKVSDEELKMEYVSDGTLKLAHRNGALKLTTLPASEFPVQQECGEAVAVLRYDAKTYAKDIQLALPFVGDDDYRPMMKAIRAFCDNGHSGVAATDTHALCCNEHPDSQAEGVGYFIMPAIAKTLVALCAAYEEVSVTVYPQRVRYSFADAEIFSTPLTGRFPDFRRAIPAEPPHAAILDRRELSTALSRILSFGGQIQLIKVRFNVDGTVTLKTSDESFSKSAQETLTCDHDLPDGFIMGWHGSYALRCLGALEGDKVTVRLSDPSRAFLFSDGNPDKAVLLMPMTVTAW